jgi:hypothetical protein
MAVIDPQLFADRVFEASKAAFSTLIAENAGQPFYAFALFTDDSLQFMYPAANTDEALTATVQRYRETVDPQYDTISTRTGMRWSYGDWGFFPYETGDHFAEVNSLLSKNFDTMMDDDAFEGVLETLWAAALSGFRRLETEGFFGTGSARSAITLLPVGDLPEELVQSWVSALNPPDVAERFAKYDAGAPDAAE